MSRCFPDKVQSVQWVSTEDLCVIILDSGAVDNHMPNKVMESIQLVAKTQMQAKPQCGELFELNPLPEHSENNQSSNGGAPDTPLTEVVTNI